MHCYSYPQQFGSSHTHMYYRYICIPNVFLISGIWFILKPYLQIICCHICIFTMSGVLCPAVSLDPWRRENDVLQQYYKILILYIFKLSLHDKTTCYIKLLLCNNAYFSQSVKWVHHTDVYVCTFHSSNIDNHPLHLHFLK